jgi:type I restriction enzyme S subunit
MNNDWIEVELGEVCEINMGQSPPSSSYNYDRNGLPFFQGKAEFTELYPEVKKWCDTPKKVASINDILISVRAPVGATNLANQVCAIGRGLAAISYPKCYKYIFYYLRFIEQLLDAKGTGSTFKAISGSILRSQTIPLAPLPEQRAIVAKIEQLFSELDNGIQNLKTAQRKLTLYRQAVLKKAFEGGFTEQWRKEQGIVDYSNSEVWQRKCLEEVSNSISGYAFKSKEFIDDGGNYQVIRMGNVRPGIIRLDESPAFLNDIEEKILEKFLLQKNDVIITLTGTRNKRDYGHTVIINKSNLLLNQRIAALRFHRTYSPKFFLYYSWTNGFRDQFFSFETGNVGQGNVGIKAVKSSTIPLPSPNEQNQIVQEIESRLSVCDKVQETINQNLQKAEALRQSILKKAFAGNLLTQQELTACRNEPDYAPASELLKEIVN